MNSLRRWSDKAVTETAAPVPGVPDAAEEAARFAEDKPEDADSAGERAR